MRPAHRFGNTIWEAGMRGEKGKRGYRWKSQEAGIWEEGS